MAKTATCSSAKSASQSVLSVEASASFQRRSRKERQSMNITIRRTEPSDFEAIHAIFMGAQAIWGTLQLPFPSAEQWRKRLAEPDAALFSLVACADAEVIGQLGL